MKFVKLGRWRVRADLVRAVNYWSSTVEIHCGGDEKYSYSFESRSNAVEAYNNLIASLENTEIRG